MELQTNLKKLIILASVSIISLFTVYSLANKRNEKFIGRAGVPTSIVDTKVVKITKNLITFDGTKNSDLDITVNGFNYVGSVNQISTAQTNPWFNIKSSTNSLFTQPEAVGSALNKWKLTSVTLEYATQTGTIGQENIVKLNDIEMFRYISSTDKNSLTGLNSNKTQHTHYFSVNDNITKFKIEPTYNLYITNIQLTYMIDYSNC